MDASDWVAIYAGIVGTAALALEVRRWVESGPLLYISHMYPGQTIGGPNEDKTYIFVNVTNRGNAPCTITHMLIFDYGNWWNWLRRERVMQAIVPQPGLSGPQSSTPHHLEVGRTWIGGAIETPDLRDRIAKGRVYVGIASSHRNREFMRRIRAPKDRTSKT